VTVRSLRIASDETDEAIIQYARRAYNLLIGERTAESIKIAVGAACPQREEQMTAVRGRDLVSGLPRAVPMTGTEIRAAIAEPIAGIVAAVKMTLERTPPQLAADIVDRGIMMAGGGSLLGASTGCSPRKRGCRSRSPMIRWVAWCWDRKGLRLAVLRIRRTAPAPSS
jgi:rod shape-determining protein MreB